MIHLDRTGVNINGYRGLGTNPGVDSTKSLSWDWYMTPTEGVTIYLNIVNAHDTDTTTITASGYRAGTPPSPDT